MKKIYSIVALLAVVLISTSAMAVPADKELCLFTSVPATDSTPSSERTLTLTYTGLDDGHVIFYGESCYIIGAIGQQEEVRDCMPVFGSGILYEDILEIGLQGVEAIVKYGARVLLSGTTHIWLSTNTLDGTLTGESVYYIGGERQEVYEFLPIAAVKCPAISQQEIAADKKFKKLIEQLDKLGNQ